MTNWRLNPSQRVVLAIAGFALLYHAYDLLSDDRSVTLPLLAGALLLTASLAGSSTIENLALGTWSCVKRHWKALSGLLLISGLFLAAIAYRHELDRQAEEKRWEAEYAAGRAADEAHDRKIRAEFESCVKAVRTNGANGKTDSTGETEIPSAEIQLGEARCAYIRDSAALPLDPVERTIRRIRAEHSAP